MIQFDLPKEQSSIIKVIGVGGGGSNAVNYMHYYLCQMQRYQLQKRANFYLKIFHIKMQFLIHLEPRY